MYDLDSVLDAAESLAVEAGPAGVTTRSVAAAAGVSNGAIYHNFGSRTELVARTWLRAARRIPRCANGIGRRRAGRHRSRPRGIAAAAAAQAPAVFYERQRQSAKLVWRVQRDQLLGPDLPASLAAELQDLDRQLIDLMVRLSSHLWDRRDGAAVDAITVCIVDLPTAIILSRNRISNSWARDRLTAAVRAVLCRRTHPNQEETTMTITVTYQDKIAILNLGDDENRFSLGFLDDINGAIDDLVAGGAQALVTTGAGKFYSNGLDLDWLMAHGDQMQSYVGRVHALFARVLTLPIPTAAAVNGHARRRRHAGDGARTTGPCAPTAGSSVSRGRHPDSLHPRHGRADPGQADAAGGHRVDDHRPAFRR